MVHLLQHLHFWLRCPSFLLSKFATQLKLMQSVVWVEILGICVASSTFRVLLSRFWVSGLLFPSPKDPFPVPVPGSWMSGSRVPVSQGSRVPGSQVQEPRVSGSQDPESQDPESQGPGVLGLRSQGPRSRIPGPDFRLRPNWNRVY